MSPRGQSRGPIHTAAKPTSVPQKIKILREKDYHTHHIGRCSDGTQFMGFIVGVPARRTGHTARWYAALHRFDADGNHLGSEARALSTGAILGDLPKARAKLRKMIARLGKVKYRDVEIKLFSVRIDGHLFGLVDASEPAENYQRIDLLPNELAFFPPWDGTYDT